MDVQKKKKSKNREAKDSCPKQGNPVEKKDEEKKKSDSEEMAKVVWDVEINVEKSQAQLQVVSEAQSRNLLALSSTKLTDAGVESAIQLKIELHSLVLRLISWVSSQKQCVKSLNGWLLKCLLPDKPTEKQLPAEEEYPPVFALCEKWSNSLDAISETEVVNAVQSLLGDVNKLLEQQHVHVQERVTADKGMERKVKALEREEQRLKKLLQGHGIGKRKPCWQDVSSYTPKEGLKPWRNLKPPEFMPWSSGHQMGAWHEPFHNEAVPRTNGIHTRVVMVPNPII
ncbi:hypothetical protein LINPERHAP2_LOCUS11188 [Linum perenne]